MRALVSRLHTHAQMTSETMIVTSNNQPVIDGARYLAREKAIVVSTPLDAIVRLENRPTIGTVVLAGSFSKNHELASFLGAFYPSVRVRCDA